MTEPSEGFEWRDDGTIGINLGKALEQTTDNVPAWAYDVVMSLEEAREFTQALERSVFDAINPDLADTTYEAHAGSNILTVDVRKSSTNTLPCGNCEYGTDREGNTCPVCHGHSDTPMEPGEQHGH